MAIRIIVGLIWLLAIVQGLAAEAVPAGIVALALVVLGLVYGGLAIDAEDRGKNYFPFLDGRNV